MKYDVFLVGNASMDFIFTGLPRMPLLGEDTLATGFNFVPGESFTNAIALHRLGVRVAWAADFGNDTFSKLILEQVREEGLSEEYFVFHDRPFRRISISESFSHERAFLTFYDKEPEIPAALKAIPRVKADTLFIPGLIQGTEYDAAFSIIKLKKMRIIMDGNCPKEYSVATKSVGKSIGSVDVFIPNAKEARSLTGIDDLEKAAAKLSEYCPLIVVKDGCNGSFAYDRKSITCVPGIPVNPVDTTGAGDCYSSGFLKAYLDGLPVQNCLQWGNIVGGLSTLGPGGTSFKVSVETVKENVRKYYSK